MWKPQNRPTIKVSRRSSEGFNRDSGTLKVKRRRHSVDPTGSSSAWRQLKQGDSLYDVDEDDDVTVLDCLSISKNKGVTVRKVASPLVTAPKKIEAERADCIFMSGSEYAKLEEGGTFPRSKLCVFEKSTCSGSAPQPSTSRRALDHCDISDDGDVLPSTQVPCITKKCGTEDRGSVASQIPIELAETQLVNGNVRRLSSVEGCSDWKLTCLSDDYGGDSAAEVGMANETLICDETSPANVKRRSLLRMRRRPKREVLEKKEIEATPNSVRKKLDENPDAVGDKTSQTSTMKCTLLLDDEDDLFISPIKKHGFPASAVQEAERSNICVPQKSSSRDLFSSQESTAAEPIQKSRTEHMQRVARLRSSSRDLFSSQESTSQRSTRVHSSPVKQAKKFSSIPLDDSDDCVILCVTESAKRSSVDIKRENSPIRDRSASSQRGEKTARTSGLGRLGSFRSALSRLCDQIEESPQKETEPLHRRSLPEVTKSAPPKTSERVIRGITTDEEEKGCSLPDTQSDAPTQQVEQMVDTLDMDIEPTQIVDRLQCISRIPTIEEDSQEDEDFKCEVSIKPSTSRSLFAALDSNERSSSNSSDGYRRTVRYTGMVCGLQSVLSSNASENKFRKRQKQGEESVIECTVDQSSTYNAWGVQFVTSSLGTILRLNTEGDLKAYPRDITIREPLKKLEVDDQVNILNPTVL